METNNKLREALEACVAEMCDRCRELAAARGNPLPCLSGCEPVRKAKLALSKPVRNCDRFGTDNAEASLAYEEFCDRAEVEESVNGAIAWLLSPDAEQEGETDGDK